LNQGDPEAGSRKLTRAIDALQAFQFQVVTPWLMGALAECRSALGAREDGLAIIEDALLLVIRNGDHANLPDLLRIKGEMLAQDPSDSRAAAMSLQEALAWSTAQSAPAWRLRAAISLAQLYRSENRFSDSISVLENALAEFALDERSVDYSVAEEMLRTLRRHLD
jgi:hypothetical protein